MPNMSEDWLDWEHTLPTFPDKFVWSNFKPDPLKNNFRTSSKKNQEMRDRWWLTFCAGSHGLTEVSTSKVIPGQDLELIGGVRSEGVYGKHGGWFGDNLHCRPLRYLSIHTAVPEISQPILNGGKLKLINISQFSEELPSLESHASLKSLNIQLPFKIKIWT